jgi:hypothetical protein
MKSAPNKNKARHTPEPKEAVITPPQVSIFDKYGIKLAMGLIALVAFVCFKDFILGQKIYLYKDIGSDSLNASWPWMVQSSEYISRYGVPSWSFNMGMGQNILSFSFYDPFDYLLYPFGKETMIKLIVWKELAKILLAGFIFFRYLKLLKLSNYVATIGAMMYAFSGYMILGSGWFLFSFEVMNAALLLLSFELLYQKNQWYWLPLPVFLMGISRPFNFWLYAIFLVLYILFRLVQDDQKIDFKKAALLFGKLIAVSLIGLGLSAPLLMEHIRVILESPRGSGPDSYSAVLSSGPMLKTASRAEFGTGMLRFFSSDILGSGIKFKGWQNFLEAAVFYCGIPCLLLCTQVFQFLKKPVKRAAILLLVFWLLPFIFPYFRQAIWLFSGDYYRTYSFFVALVLIIYSVSSFDKIISEQKINLTGLVVSLLVLLILLNYPYFDEKNIIDGGIKFFSNLSLLLYAGIIYAIAKNRNNLSYKYIFIGWLLVELTYFSWCTINRRDNVLVRDLANKVGYNDYTVDAVGFLKKTDQSFYRIDKNYYSSPAIHGSLNDAMVQDYYGTSSYNPFNQKYYIDYLKTMGIINKVNELESRWSPGLGNRIIQESLNDVKYVFSKSGYAQPMWHITHDSIARFGDVLVLRNKFALPFGFGYSKFMKLSDFEKLSPSQKDFISTKACVVKDEDASKVSGLTEFTLKDTLPVNAFTFDVLKRNIDSLRTSQLQLSSFAPTALKGTVKTPRPEMLYVSMPYEKNWTITDNGQPAEKFILSNGMTGILLQKGDHTIDFAYSSGNFRKGLWLAVLTLICYLGILFYYKRKAKQAVS